MKPEQIPASVSVRYTIENTIELSDLEEKHGFKWSDVEDWWIKYDILTIKIGEETTSIPLESSDENVDWKYPGYACLLDQNDMEIETEVSEYGE